ncbi:MAG: alpha/beta hydrolase [Spirochaetae bacterium HGW-Spirochaetae-4]|nr:MAG: alpha/beta hydrolase [Spirochaetae bacterium HGW-Spirochaetae-4]
MKHSIQWGIWIALALVLFLMASSCSHTQKVYDARGKEIELEVDTRDTVTINGTQQTIYVAGASRDNPVLLWLDGGPGGSEVGWVRPYLGPLHEHFTIVCWDQRGTAASFAAGRDGLSVQQFTDDVIVLSKLLATRFNQEKIFLVGHSWGSVIGLMAAQQEPDLFHAYIGAAQQVNSVENDSIGYEMILEGARTAGDAKTVKTMEKLGYPPYVKRLSDGTEVPDGDAYYQVLSRLYHYSPSAPADANYRSEKMFLAPEHSFFDRINLIRGVVRGVKQVYPLLSDLDFERDVTELECPLFIVNGRYDMSCVATISERWYNQVEAPVKDLLWLEKSGHNAVYSEADEFMRYMVETVLPLSDFDGDLDDFQIRAAIIL